MLNSNARSRPAVLNGAGAASAGMMTLNAALRQAWAAGAYSARAMKLVEPALVIDMLAPLKLEFTPEAFAEPLKPAEAAQFRASAFTGFHKAVGLGGPTAYEDAPAFLAAWQGFAGRNAELVSLVGTTTDLDRAEAHGKVAAIKGIRNADHICDAAVVETFFQLGQRCSRLTCDSQNLTGGGGKDRVDGSFGTEIIKAMNEVDMPVDASHFGDKTRLDAIDISPGPIAITHSNRRALDSHPRQHRASGRAGGPAPAGGHEHASSPSSRRSDARRRRTRKTGGGVPHVRQVIVALLVAGLAAGPAYARTRAATAVAQPAAGAVEAEIRRLSASIGGAVGVAAWRLDGRGPRVVVNGAERFPMASTFKVAVAGAILKKVDDGALTLDQMIAVPPSLMVPSEVLADRFIHPGVSLSVHNLLELMLTQSDNSATDVLVAAAGGPAGVTAWVRAQGVDDLRIDRDTAGLLRDFFRLPPGPLGPAFEAAAKADPALESSGGRPNPAFDDDPRDSSTPQAMAKLLERIFGGHALRPASTQALIAIMERCRTGTARLRGRLPTGVTVADKTGTIGGSVNDVGVITLPDGAGQLVVAVFIKKSDAPFDARERVIADIGRSLYDFYLFQGDR